MATPAEIFAQAEALLKEDKVQAAADLLHQANEDATAAADAAAGKKPPPPPPRAPTTVLVDLLDAISSRLGHPPTVKKLLDELKAVEPKS